MKSSIYEMEIDEILKTTQILSRAVQPLSKIIKDIEDNEKLSKEDEFWLKTINQNEEIQQAAQNLIWKIQHLQEDNLRQD
jgi:flagellar biosynthesis/type III secretory pathway chaperone